MPVKLISYSNQEIAEILTNVAVAYELKNKNRFRIISYQNAADTIATYPHSVYEIWTKNHQAINDIPGIGEAIMGKLNFLFTKGKFHHHWQAAFKGLHPAIFTFIKINGIGPKTAHILTQNLKFSRRDMTKALEELIIYAQNGKLRNLPKLGEKSENDILTNTQNFIGRKEKMPLSLAQAIADNVVSYIKKQFPSLEIQPLGSLRREAPLVGDIDIAVQSDNASPILDYFIHYPLSVQTIAKGEKKASLRIKNDIRIDIMVQPKNSWGSLLQHFTGSKQHNIKLREYASKLGLSLSEYGIKDITTGTVHQFDNETSFYNFIGLNFIPPQDRLGENEIETYQKGV